MKINRQTYIKYSCFYITALREEFFDSTKRCINNTTGMYHNEQRIRSILRNEKN